MREFLSRIADVGFLRVSDTGFCAGVVQPHPLCKSWLVATEFLWWGDAHLLRAWRKWAREQSPNEIIYSCPVDVPAAGFFAKIAKPSETIYSEVL